MTIIVLRFLADGSLASARPCSLCTECIAKAGISKIVYSTSDAFLVSTRVETLMMQQGYITAGSLEYGKIHELRRYLLRRIR